MNQALLSFNNGEVTPYLRHRIDFDKTASSAEVMENFLPMPYGGVIKRPGLVYVGDTAEVAGENSRAFPFIASTGERYLLHFTVDKLTIYGLDGTAKASLSFMDGYAWPEAHDFDQSIRLLQMVQVNDLAFFTHPGTHPLRLTRYSDTSWALDFMEFTNAPMLDENTDVNLVFTVAGNPIAAAWSGGTAYGVGAVVFSSLAEWVCTKDHTAAAATEPGVGEDFLTCWTRRLFLPGDPVTITNRSKSGVPSWGLFWNSYEPGDIITGDAYEIAGGLMVYVGVLCTEAVTMAEDYIFTAADTITPGTPWVNVAVWEGGEAIGIHVNHLGSIYKCIATHTNNFIYEPGVGEQWGTAWEIVGAMPAAGQWLEYHTKQFIAGNRVLRGGMLYECTTTHWPRVNNYTGGSWDAVYADPGTGQDWLQYWTLIQEFAGEETPVSAFSPGIYWRMSPQRVAEDFQVELRAVVDNDGKTSQTIVVDGGWNVFTYGTWTGVFTLESSTDGGATWDTLRSYEAENDRNVADSGTVDAPTLMRLRFTATDGTADGGRRRAVLVPESPYVTGEALATAYVDADTMTGIAKSAMLSGGTYRWAHGAFSPAQGYPRAIALHESRLCLAGTAARPVSMWLSATDDLINFEVGTEADASIYATLALTNASPIRWMSSQRRLYLGTAFGEWVTGSETSDQPITPTNFIARQYSAYGSAPVQPLIANDGVFFVERKGTRLRVLGFSNETQSYESADLTILAEHITREGVSNMAWQQTREPGLWVVRRDGVLLHFGYNRMDKIQAWSRHLTTGGTFLDVVVFPSDAGDDEVFFILVRGEATVIERFPQHWQDAYETGTGYHCTDGADDAPVVSILRSLPIDTTAQNGGTTQGGRKRQHKLTLSTVSSAGGHVWNTSEARKQPVLPVGDPIALTTGWVDIVPDAGHLDDLQLNLRHADPCPFILRSAVVRWVHRENTA